MNTCTRIPRCISRFYKSQDEKELSQAADDYKRPSEKYVLKPFNKRYQSLVQDVITFANEAMQAFLDNGEEFTMNNYNNQTIGVA